MDKRPLTCHTQCLITCVSYGYGLYLVVITCSRLATTHHVLEHLMCKQALPMEFQAVNLSCLFMVCVLGECIEKFPKTLTLREEQKTCDLE